MTSLLKKFICVFKSVWFIFSVDTSEIATSIYFSRFFIDESLILKKFFRSEYFVFLWSKLWFNELTFSRRRRFLFFSESNFSLNSRHEILTDKSSSLSLKFSFLLKLENLKNFKQQKNQNFE